MHGRRLRLGPIEIAGHRVSRSGLRWLCEDGQQVRPNQIVAYCNLALGGVAWTRDSIRPFAEEGFDLQVALAPMVGGRIRHATNASRGGFIDRLPGTAWDAGAVWASIEDVRQDSADADGTALMFLAGRRFTDIAEDRSGLSTGWHDRRRAWWGEGTGSTLLGAGICEQEAVLRGGGIAFADMFDLTAGPVQIVLSQDEPLVPCAGVLAEQLARSPQQIAAIRDDLSRGIADESPGAADWLFAGALLNALERSPLAEPFDMISRSGMMRAGPADALCLSLTAELPHAARHRQLGYTVNLHNFRLAAAPPAVGRWLRRAFEPFERTVDRVASDYRALIVAAAGRPIFVINAMASPAHERIRDYRALDERTAQGLAGVRAKTLNLMLHDLQHEGAIEIVDADAIAADMGTAIHLPDGAHASGALYGEIRGELLRLLQARGVPGFVNRC